MDLWDSMKYNNIHITGAPEVEEQVSEQEIENLFKEIMTKYFPNPVRENDKQVKEAQRVPIKIDQKRLT